MARSAPRHSLVASSAATPRPAVMDHAYWGPAFGEEAIAAVTGIAESEIAVGEVPAGTDRRREASLCRSTAGRSPTGRSSAGFRAGWNGGPRAFGNRSIVCDPRRADMKEILNLKIKRRESFRPFAPSILARGCGRVVRGRR